MGKVAAYIDNKVCYEIWAEGKQLEKVLVHPNLLVIPEKDSVLSLSQSDTTNPMVRINREIVIRVLDVQFRQSITRRIARTPEGEDVDAQMKQGVIVLAEVLQVRTWGGVHIAGPVVTKVTITQ